MSKIKRKILIVDDDLEIRGLLSEYLTGRGYQVLTSSDGWACLWDLVVGKPDAIIMDLEMPKIDGLTAMDIMKVTHLTDHIPIIVASAKGDKETILKTSKLGADDFIVKPYSFEELSDRLDNLILPVDRNVLSEMIGMANEESKITDSLPEFNIAEYKAWDAFPILYRGRDFCILMKKNVSLAQARSFEGTEAQRQVAILAKFRHHWKCVWPQKDPQLVQLAKLTQKAA